jgi:hypothetical protein
VKRFLIGCWLIAFAVWPLVHYALAAAYGLAPSRFAGWATFAAPELPPAVVLFRIELQGAVTVDDIQAAKVSPQRWSGDLRSAQAEYATARADFGRLAPPPERLGRKLLEEHGATGMVLVAVQTRTINRASGLLEAGIEKYVYSDRDKVKAELRGGNDGR